ncbi:MAG: biopolymer transporter ExbD [Bdellovibrionota bacterium]
MFSKRKKRNLNSELNLVPFIDLLSVCISFLLLTAVWVSSGALSTKQGLGTEAEASKDNDTSIWVELSSPDIVLVSTKNSKGVATKKQQVAIKTLSDYAANLKAKDENLKAALVLPNVDSSYDEMIRAMNSLRKAEFKEIGLAPL